MSYRIFAPECELRRPVRVTNGCADNTSGTSEVHQLADPLCATRKSAEVGQEETWPPSTPS
jgi:hypothetical protein